MSAGPHGQEPRGLRRDTELHAIYPVLCSSFSKNPAARRSPSSQTPRQPCRGIHPTHKAQDSDTLSRSHNRRTTDGSKGESPSNSDGSPAMQAPPATRRPMSGQRWQHGSNAAKNNCLTSSAARPSPTRSEVPPSEVGRGTLRLEQAPRVPTTEEDAARPDANQS